MKRLIYFGLWCFLALRCFGQPAEEWSGPLAGWANLQTRFGAKGDGRTDDSRAIQTALDSLSCFPTGFNTGSRRYTVIYLPAGVYCISSTLLLRGKIGVSLVGEDPSKTRIRWTGKDDDTLLWANGSAYFKISRLGWDANGRKGLEAIGIHWKEKWNRGQSRSFASLNIEISDQVFTGGFKYGISGGTFNDGGTGWNDSEVTIRRCLFQSCSGAGIEIHGYNALDYWIWDCRFLQCGIGIRCGEGNYHVYHSFFSGSRVADLSNNNCYYTSARSCYSENGTAFSLDEGSSCNPFKRIFQDNSVIRPNHIPVEYYHLGKITLLGNRFDKTVTDPYAFSINTRSWCPGIYEVLSLHNDFAFQHPIRIASGPSHLYSYGDRDSMAIQASADLFIRSLSPLPVRKIRKIFEIPEDADATTIQAVLDQAAQFKGRRPIVHFSTGTYQLDHPLVIRAGADMQLIGDGLIYSTMLVKKNQNAFAGQPLLRVEGPSFLRIMDMQWGDINGGDDGDAIVFYHTDQPGAEVHIDQQYSHSDTSLVAENLDHLYIEKDNSFFSSGNSISGGGLRRSGKGEAKVCCFGGQFARLKLQNNAEFVAKDCWWEGSDRIPLALSGWGSFSLDGAMIAPQQGADSNSTILLHDFRGAISFQNIYLQGAISPGENLSLLDILVWNVMFYHKMRPLDFLDHPVSFHGAFLGITAQCFDAKNPDCQNVRSIEDQQTGITDLLTFVDRLTAWTQNNSPVPFRDLASGISNIYITRVSTGTNKRGLVFAGG